MNLIMRRRELLTLAVAGLITAPLSLAGGDSSQRYAQPCWK